MAVNLSPVGGVAAQFFSNNGVPLAGGKIFTYAAGTTTPAATYTTSLGNVAWTNPIVLDAAGRVPGSGEIWLFDGTIYKFILKDSNDVLIATYDNITGINSNFVNFTAQQEIQTATAGQTVFDLTTMQYQPGTNSLTVYVDGVNQYGPGAQYAYLETDSDTVTFLSGLHVGASVKFTTTTQTSGNATDASVVAYTPPFTGGVTTNVEDKLAQYISVKDFGAVGDGIVDDTAAIQAALNADGDVWFSLGSYKITTSLVLKGAKRIVGESTNTTNGRNQVRILPSGNFPAFINDTTIKGKQYHIEGFNIFWENVTPAAGESATKGNRYGFKFDNATNPQYTAPYSQFIDIEVNGAWYVYYDDSDNYLNKFKSVVGRFCRFGFYKRLGTLMHFEECGNSIGAQGFHFDNTVSPILVNCAADNLTPDASTPGLAGNYFVDANSISILGWDAENALISGDNYSYMNFTRTYGTITGFTGLENELGCAAGQFVSWFLFTDNSNITVSGFTRKFSSSANYTFVGSAGDVATIRSIVSSRCTLINSDVRAPSGGTPTNRYSIYAVGGFATVIDSLFDNQFFITTRIVDGNVIATNLTAGTAIGFAGAQNMYSGTAIPVSGTYSRGDVVWNATPSAGGAPGWVCVTSGTPGTWKAMANLAV